MRCHEARQRVKDLRGQIDDQNSNLELKHHLKSCAACAALARSEQMLERDFQLMAVDDDTGDLPLSILRTRVEAEVASAESRNKERTFMSVFTNIINRKPRLALTLSVAAVLLLIGTLIPFKFEQTVGYQVALAGVDKHLAMDSERIDLLLKELGIEDAVANVGDCEATCRLVISQLDSEHDVKVIMAAFDELGSSVLEDVEEISGEESSTLFGQAAHRIFKIRMDPDNSEDEAEIRAFVLERLNALSSDSMAFSVWVSSCSDSTADSVTMTIDVDAIGGNAYFFADSLIGQPGSSDGMVSTMIKIDQSTGEAGTIVITDGDGNVQEFNLDDPEAIAKIEEMGLGVDILSGLGDGSGQQKFIMKTVELVTEIDDNSDQGPAAKQIGEPNLPETYSLSQNYPNPFNPTTTISYSLVEGTPVRLEIYNIKGQTVRTLVDQYQSAGEHSVEWNATDESGTTVASGVYFYRLTAGEFTESKKMSLVR